MVRVGVIGAGYLGKFHIQKLTNIPNCKLTAICEVSEDILSTYKDHGIFLTTNYRELLGLVDAVSIVVPTTYHYEIAEFFLRNGVHIFLEKPATSTSLECEKLLNIQPQNLIVQVGHIERFNPVFNWIKGRANKPIMMNFIRKSPFTNRGTDVDIVFDLMIHDIDLSLSFFPEPVKIENIISVGAKIVTNKNDYMFATINIDDVIINYECSRVSSEKERKITIIEKGRVFEGDLINFSVFQREFNKEELIRIDNKVDALNDELKVFINCIIERKNPPVTLKDGLRALKCAENILKTAERQ
ncbi:MAG: Gfo/Idh/MocA family oxidoreductase [Proteobacteria bacterium]|nr:Gfo/Idh/MocA family oxidoreductase [Pseudomonadota bacterium]